MSKYSTLCPNAGNAMIGVYIFDINVKKRQRSINFSKTDHVCMSKFFTVLNKAKTNVSQSMKSEALG